MFDKDKQLEARKKLTEEIMAFQDGKKDCVLELGTGTGKTFQAMTISRSLAPQSILFVVPQSTMIQNFIDDVNKLGFEELLPITEIICYASLKKYVGRSFDVIVLDEAHNLFSDTRMKLIQQITGKKRILLSATLDGTVKEKLSTAFEMNIFSCPYEQAVKRCILPPLEMEVYSVYLDDIEKKYPHKYKGAKKETMLTAVQYYKMLDDKVKNAVEKWKNRAEIKGNPMWAYNKMLRAGGDRQAFVGAYKTELIQQVMEENEGTRMIVFCASKEQAHTLGGEMTVSSDNTAKQNKKIVEDFNAGLANKIFSKSMLIEGMNLFDTPLAIVAGLGSKELKSSQQIGRTLRHHSPRMIILAVAGTVDEKFLESSFKINIYGERL